MTFKENKDKRTDTNIVELLIQGSGKSLFVEKNYAPSALLDIPDIFQILPSILRLMIYSNRIEPNVLTKLIIITMAGI